MKEGKIISFIGVYGCLILSHTSEGRAALFWVVMAALYFIRFAYLNYKSL